MLLYSHDKHTAWVNTCTIERCGVTKDTTVPDGNVIEREEDGYPSGTFREFAAIDFVTKILPEYGKEDYKKAIRWGQDFFASLGVPACRIRYWIQRARPSRRSMKWSRTAS